MRTGGIAAGCETTRLLSLRGAAVSVWDTDVLDESFQIRCPKCKSVFREKARRVISGYSRQCPSCEVMIFFEDGTSDKNVVKALLDAKRLRRAITEEAEAELTAKIKPAAPYKFGR